MKFKAAGIGIGWLLLLLCTPVAVAEYDSDEQTRPAFTQQELDQMLAPIALYPDALLSQILMAATYPLEVVQAARWSSAHPELTGDQAVKAVEQRDWDPSVISLTAFPQILVMMDEKLDWTERLGDAFLSQESQVMDTIQNLRQRAMAAGNLQSNDQIRVEQQGQTIVIIQAVPQIVYVPYYNPIIVYGPWWWDAYPPIYWDPWPGYYYRPGFSVSFFWGIGIPVSAGFFYGDCDWHHRRVNIVNVNNYYYNTYHTSRYSSSQTRSPTSPATTFKRGSSVPVAWQHDPEHRRGVPYRVPSLQQKFERSGAVPKGDLGRFKPSSRETIKQPALRPEAGTATRKIPEIRSNVQPKVIPGQDFRPDTTDKFKRRDVPETGRTETIISPRSLPEIRSNVQPKGSGSDLRSNVIERPSRHVPDNDRAVQSIPRPSVAPSRIGPESRPQGFEGAGQGERMRGLSERGYNIQQQTIPNSRSMPAGGIQERAAPAQQRFDNNPNSRGGGNNSFDRTNPHSWKP